MLNTFVSAAPKFGEFNDQMIMKAGSSSSVDIPFVAHPQPTVSVQFEGGEVRDASRILTKLTENQSSFSVNKSERPDTGDYIITLENPFGKTTGTIKVQVLGEYLDELNIDTFIVRTIVLAGGVVVQTPLNIMNFDSFYTCLNRNTGFSAGDPFLWVYGI